MHRRKKDLFNIYTYYVIYHLNIIVIHCIEILHRIYLLSNLFRPSTKFQLQFFFTSISNNNNETNNNKIMLTIQAVMSHLSRPAVSPI